MATKTKSTKKPAAERSTKAKGKAVKAAKKPAAKAKPGRASGRHQDGPAAGLACRQGRFQRRALRGAGLAAPYVARGGQPAPGNVERSRVDGVTSYRIEG
jgi:hypothetical protein